MDNDNKHDDLQLDMDVGQPHEDNNNSLDNLPEEHPERIQPAREGKERRQGILMDMAAYADFYESDEDPFYVMDHERKILDDASTQSSFHP